MSDVVFVHGTGVRLERFHDLLSQVQAGVARQEPGARVHGCYWGNTHAASLKAAGRSIPDYEQTGGRASEDDGLWEAILRDPLYELAILLDAPPSGGDDIAVTNLHTWCAEWDLVAATQARIGERGLAEYWEPARRQVMGSDEFELVSQLAPSFALMRRIVRSVVAEAVGSAEKAGASAMPIQALRTLAQLIYSDTGCATHGGIMKAVTRPLVALATARVVGDRRGELTDGIGAFIGDILKYQQDGAALRQEIKNAVIACESPNVALIGHSLGGIACFELLAKEKFPQVKTLITIGSQAPYLYELDVLSEIRFGEELPPFFPTWRNVYDPEDILSYRANGLFSQAQDIRVDNRRTFPGAHSAYFLNNQMWDQLDLI